MHWNFTDILRTAGDAPLSGKGEPLLVEIGFGNGEFLEHLARTRQDALVVGIEVSQWCICKAARRALAANLKNIRLIHGDARGLLSRAFEPASIAGAYMNFPCPWPKRRHAARRVSSPRFAELMAGCLAPQGTFTLASDVGWYAEKTLETFAANGDFTAEPVLKNPVREYRTKYERKWIRMGRDIYTVTARKKEGAVRVTRAGEGGADEPLEMEAHVYTDDISGAIRSLEGDRIEGPGYCAVFGEVFESRGGTALALVIAVDDGFEQHFRLRFTPTKGGLRCKADAVGHPYRTPGVRASMRHVMEKIGAKF